MTITTVLAVLSCFALGAITAYLDISSFFREKKIGVGSVFRQWASATFLVGNGLIAVVLLLWALSDPQAEINSLVSFDSPLAKGIAIGLAVPLILRSKWFSITKEDGNRPAGLEAIYDRVRGDVLHSVNRSAIRLKSEILKEFSARLAGRKEVPGLLVERVLLEEEPFRTEKELEELRQESARYDRMYAANLACEEHVGKLIKWAMDTCGIAPIRRHLRDLAAQA